MNKNLIIAAVGAVVIGGAVVLMNRPDSSGPASAPAGADATATAAPSETITYEISACIDDKATLVLNGDRLRWTNITGEGTSGEGCPEDMRNKTQVTVSHNGGAGWPETYATPPGANAGPLKVAVPFREVMTPATVEVINTSSFNGVATLVKPPTNPDYEVQIAFDDSDPNAHTYTVRLTLEYK